MPELPEVETIVRSLRNPCDLPLIDGQALNTRPGVVGRKIAKGELLWARSLAESQPDEFLARIVGQKVYSAERRGKFIILLFEAGALLIHLRMSGDLRVESDQKPVQTHDRLLIDFVDGIRLTFNDTRKFGRVWLVDDIQRVVGGLGPEPFDARLTGEVLFNRLHTSLRCVKTLLLDQSVIAGLGNIYSDEALHLAGIHPSTPGRELSGAQVDRLLQAVRETLKEGIRHNGASLDWVYRGGDFQNYFRVYQRAGEPCASCGTKIERMVINQRSTHFCPRCQPFIKIE